MAIAYSFTKVKDKYNLYVQQDTTVELKFVCESSKVTFEDIVYSGNTLILPTGKDGSYNMILGAEGETDITVSFTYIENLRKSILSDVCNILLQTYYGKKDCNVSSKEEIDLIEYKNIYSKLLTFQNLYFPVIGLNLSSFFSVFLSKVVEAKKCNFYNDVNFLLKEECLYGNSKLNSKLFKKFLLYYYVGFYNIERNIAGEDAEELEYIETKYNFAKLDSVFNELCISLSNLNVIFGSVISSNTPPTIDDYILDIPSNLVNNLFSYDFNGTEFATNFTDIQGNLPNNIKFFTLPVRGELTFDGDPVEINVPYPYEDVAKFNYLATVDVVEDIFDILVFQISDDNINESYSEMATMTMNSAQYVNQPISQLGDGVIPLNNRENHVYTINDFTTNLNPPYSDPEGDTLDAIRVNALPAAGVLRLNAIAVTAGQIISAANINAGNFTFEAPNQNPAASNSFDFSARDSGSLIFVD